MEALPVRGRLRQLQHNSRIVENSVNRASQIIIEPLDEGTPVGMPLQVGSFSMHHGLCPHRSGPNNSDHRRIGFALICIPTHVRPVGSVRPTAMLARGSDRHGNFELVEPPKSELDVDGLTVHERAVGLYRDAYLEEEVRHNRLPA